MANETNSTIVEDEIWAFRIEIFWEYLPLVIFFTVAGIVGVVGNIIAVKFYGLVWQPNSSFTFLVRVLGITDAMASAILLLAVAELSLNVGMRFRYVCKGLYFVSQWVIYTSSWLLVWITLDRYRKICQPFKSQMTIGFARRSLPFIILLTLVLSVRNLFLYDAVAIDVTVETGSGPEVVHGHYCTTNTVDPDIAPVVEAFHLLDIFILSCLFITYIAVYSVIIHKLVTHRRMLRSWQSTNHHHSDKGAVYSVSLEGSTCSSVNDVKACANGKTPPNCPGIKRSEYAITVMMIIVSAVFLLIFSSFFVANLLLRQSAKSKQSIAPLTHFMIKIVFINSVANPVIYYIYNRKFRNYTNCLFCCKEEPNSSTCNYYC